MVRKRTFHVRCPTCKKAVKRQDPEFPFCSGRCRLIDLGKWTSGAYVISSPLRDISHGISEDESEDSDEKS
jgi:endogenous inhibitor of DNA gyrase (YacG/DUF329 family)